MKAVENEFYIVKKIHFYRMKREMEHIKWIYLIT